MPENDIHLENQNSNPHLHAVHEYISKTCKYRFPVFLNPINNISENSDKLRNITEKIDNITLVKFKCVTKRYMINKSSYYCNVRNLNIDAEEDRRHMVISRASNRQRDGGDATGHIGNGTAATEEDW